MWPQVGIDAATPAAKAATGLVSTVISNAFTPPDQSLVLIAVGAGKSTSVPTFALTSSDGKVWNAPAPATGGATAGGVALFWAYYANSPGSITATLTTTGGTTSLFIDPVVFHGAHWDQSTSGINRSSPTTGTDGSLSVTTTRILSFIYGIGNFPGSNTTWSAIANTAADVVDSGGSTDGITIEGFKLNGLLTLPRAFTVGGTWGASGASNQIAMEIGAAPIQAPVSNARHPGKGPSNARFYKTPQDTTPPVAVDVILTVFSPCAGRRAGPDGQGVGVAPAVDTAAAQRSSGPDGTLVSTTVLTDTPSASRYAGPTGSVAIEIALTDSPAAARDYGPDGAANLGVLFGPDMPGAVRFYGPDGLLQDDLVITDRPRGARCAGPDGTVLLGVSVTDTPSASRYYGPEGSVFADVGGGVTLTDSPSASRYYGPNGALALGIVLAGDLPSGARLTGPDGSFAIDVVLSDTPSAERDGGPDGFVIAILSDTPAAGRYYGPDGFMGIALPITADTPGTSRYAGPTGLISIGVGADVIAGTASPAGTRCSGPVGEVLLAFIPSKPPYIPAAPLVAPSYSLWVADTRTGRMLWELPAESFNWSNKLNDVGTIHATLSVEKTWASLSDQDERDPRIMLREILSGPWRFSLVLKWGNNTVWAGPYLSMSRPTPGHIELNGAEIAKIFTKRPLIKPGAPSATSELADTVIGPGATKPHVAAALVTQAMVGTGYNLPIVVTDPGGFGTDFRTYYGYDLANYWDKLQALMAEVDGPEIRFDPRISAGVDGDYLTWVMQIGNPHLGRGITTWVFDSDVNAVVGLDGDGSNMALGVWTPGSGQSRDRLVAHTQDSSLLNIGWPMLEAVDNSHTSETSYPVLAAQSSASLAAYKQPLVAYKTAVPADSDPMVGTYRVGEDFSIDIHDDPIIPDGFYTRRIAALSGTEKSWVTITDANPLPVGSS
jgi:hypothetical protein